YLNPLKYDDPFPDRIPPGAAPSRPRANRRGHRAVHKRGKDRANPWLGNGFLLIVGTLLSVSIYYAFNRESGTIALKLGELKQVLQDPTVVFQNVRYQGRTELRGQIVMRDAVSESKENPKRADTIDFRAAIREYDPELQKLLDRHVGAAYGVE